MQFEITFSDGQKQTIEADRVTSDSKYIKLTSFDEIFGCETLQAVLRTEVVNSVIKVD